MRILLGLAGSFFFTCQLSASDQFSYSRHSSTYTFQLEEGNAVLDWISPSSFRFCRCWDGASCSISPVSEEKVEVTDHDTESHLELQTTYLEVEVEKKNLLVRVRNREGERLVDDSSGFRRGAEGVVVERVAGAGERFYGLGARREPHVDVRGQLIEDARPFLISSQGYGLHHTAPGRYDFDMAHSTPDRYRILLRGGGWFEYYFYYGPTPKEILEEHIEVEGALSGLRNRHFGILQQGQLPKEARPLPTGSDSSWESLCRSVYSLVNASLSAILLPAFDIGPYRSAPLPVYRRAMQLAGVSPLVFSTGPKPLDLEKRRFVEATAQLRRRWTPFLISYAAEIETRGIPLIHPLPMQFSKDEVAGKVSDEFMFGDEVLVAPICNASGRREVYLPMGIWTDLKTNRAYKGRRTIQVEQADELPLFVKNGSILPIGPLSKDEVMELHYFPRLAAEFFVYEPEVNDYTQLHAGPAGDFIRLEIEAKRNATYEWIVHHMSPARKVWSGDVTYREVADQKLPGPACWCFDPSVNNIHVRVRVAKGETHVTYISF